MHFVTLYTFWNSSERIELVFAVSCLLATKIPLIFIDWKWTIPSFIPPYGFKLKSLLQLIFDLLSRCTWHFQPSVGTSRSVNLPIRNVVYFSDVIVRMKSRWRCQHPFVHPCADVLENFCVCWDMLLWDEIIKVNILKSRRGEAFNFRSFWLFHWVFLFENEKQIHPFLSAEYLVHDHNTSLQAIHKETPRMNIQLWY